MKPLFGGSAIVATALLTSSLAFSARPSTAEPLYSQSQHQGKNPSMEAGIVNDHGGLIGAAAGRLTDEVIKGPSGEQIASPPTTFIATAYSLRGRTASGRLVARGLIAADPRVLPLGSRVLVEAGFLSGEYLVADTGGAVRGKRIDIWTPSTREAFRFGRRPVKLTVLSYGPKRIRSPRKAKR